MDDYTRLTKLEVTGKLNVKDEIAADDIWVNGKVSGLLDALTLIAGQDVNLTNMKGTWRSFVALKITAASKTVTMGLPQKTAALVANVGSNAFTLKNISSDAGTSLASGKVALLVASIADDDDAHIYVLN